jgi:hypothetical protein
MENCMISDICFDIQNYKGTQLYFVNVPDLSLAEKELSCIAKYVSGQDLGSMDLMVSVHFATACVFIYPFELSNEHEEKLFKITIGIESLKSELSKEEENRYYRDEKFQEIVDLRAAESTLGVLSKVLITSSNIRFTYYRYQEPKGLFLQPYSVDKYA